MPTSLALTILSLLISIQSYVLEGVSHSSSGDYQSLVKMRHQYGTLPLQFGDIIIPKGEGPFPIVMIIHGGCWLSQYDLTLMDSMSLDLSKRGYATWNIEYRRTEDNGGGWPGTFLDVAEGLKYIRDLQQSYPIDTTRIVLTGHSAGGHLALWLGAASQLESSSDIYPGLLPDILGIVSLAGITDLITYASPRGCGSNTPNLMGGQPDELLERYVEGSPISHLPLGISQIMISGEDDNIVPISHIQPYVDKAALLIDPIDLLTIPNAGHFEVITPGSNAWATIVEAFSAIFQTN